MRHRLIIFDFDGTLADSLPWFASVFDDVTDRYGLNPVGLADRDALRHMDSRELLARLGVRRWKLPLIARHLRGLKAAAIDDIALFPGIEDLLRRLFQEGFTLAIVSSDSESNVRRALGAHAGLIAHYACSASLFGKRAKIRRVLRHAGIDAADALAIGDEIRDLEAARAAGVAFGAVSWGYTSPEALGARAPDLIFACVDDIGAALWGPYRAPLHLPGEREGAR